MRLAGPTDASAIEVARGDETEGREAMWHGLPARSASTQVWLVIGQKQDEGQRPGGRGWNRGIHGAKDGYSDFQVASRFFQ